MTGLAGLASPDAPWQVHIPAIDLPERIHPEAHMVMWQVRGTTRLEVPDEILELVAGTATWLPAGTPHRVTVHENSVMLPAFFPVVDTATTLTERVTVTVDADLRMLFLALVQAQHTLLSPTVNLAAQVLPYIERQPLASSALPMPTAASAARIAHTLRFNPGDDRSVEALAASVHVSARTLERAFLADTDMTLRRWRRANRMEAAAVLLRQSTTIAAVAHRVGYGNLSAFHRAFKDHFAMTPREYRLRYRDR